MLLLLTSTHENQNISAHGTISNINAFTYFSISWSKFLLFFFLWLSSLFCSPEQAYVNLTRDGTGSEPTTSELLQEQCEKIQLDEFYFFESVAVGM